MTKPFVPLPIVGVSGGGRVDASAYPSVFNSGADGGAGGPTGYYHELTIDTSWMTESVSNWLMKVTQTEVPAEFWDNVGGQNKIQFKLGSTVLDMYISTYSAGSALTAYVLVPTVAVASTLTITMEYGGSDKGLSNDATVFDDYILVQDLPNDIANDVLGNFAATAYTTGMPADYDDFRDGHSYYFDVSGNETAMQNYMQLFALFNRDDGAGQGNIACAYGTGYSGLALGNGYYMQGYSSNGWIQGESDGFVTSHSTVYGVTVIEDMATNTERRIFLEEDWELAEATNSNTFSLDTLIVGNRTPDTTSGHYDGALYELRLGSVEFSHEHIRLNNFGLNPNNIAVGSLTEL